MAAPSCRTAQSAVMSASSLLAQQRFERSLRNRIRPSRVSGRALIWVPGNPERRLPAIPKILTLPFAGVPLS
jgi:hypothetical protein